MFLSPLRAFRTYYLRIFSETLCTQITLLAQNIYLQNNCLLNIYLTTNVYIFEWAIGIESLSFILFLLPLFYSALKLIADTSDIRVWSVRSTYKLAPTTMRYD